MSVMAVTGDGDKQNDLGRYETPLGPTMSSSLAKTTIAYGKVALLLSNTTPLTRG